jgi:NAD-dependent SIR2 family protein deacetylase
LAESVPSQSTLSLDAFIRAVGVNRGVRHAFFLGAGTSISSGIPSASRCIWNWKRDIFVTNNPGMEEQFRELSLRSVQERIQRWLDQQQQFPKEDAADEYAFYANRCYPIADDRRQFFENLASGKKPHIGYQLLPLLAEAGLLRSIWTTNFDGLPAKAAATSNVVAVEIGLSSTERVFRQPRDGEMICVSLHGDYRYDALKNTTEELRSQDATLLRALSETACDMNLVVIGYSGRDASVMSTLREAYSRQGTGRLYWCGFEDDTPPSHVDELLRTARQAGCREAHYVSSLGFDDLIVRLARHCLPDRLTQQARERIDSNSGQGRTAFVPFALESAPVTSVIKSNAFPVECPSEVYQFDASGFDEKGAWARLRERIEGKPIVAALQRGKIIAMGALDEIRSAFANCLKGEIVRVPVTEKDLSIADGIITRLYTDAITRGLAASKNLKVHGHNVLWEGRPFTDTTVYSVRLHVHAAATIALRRYAGRQYLVIKPSIHGTTQSGAAVDDESDKELKRQILSRQWNKKFNDALNEWRTRLLGRGPTTIEFLPNTASPFKFTVRSTPVFAKIGEHHKPAITLSPPVERAVTQTGLRLAEPQLRFSRKTGPGFVSDTQPIRGMVNNRPFDFTLTGNKFNPEVRVGIVCPSRDGTKLSQYLAGIHNTKAPDSKDEYLLTYPGFAQAFGLPLNLPKPGDGGWVNISEPSSGSSPSSGATELARNINAAVRSLRASWNPDVVVVYIPTRWKIWERYESDSVAFDLHNFVKAYCVQNGVTSQFLREHTLEKPYQCEILWWLSLSFYVKAMRTPWILETMDRESAYVGLGFSIDKKADSQTHVVMGCSHIYTSEGLGLKYRLSKIEEPFIRNNNPFMSREDARRTGDNIRELFFDSTSRLPSRVVIHKRTPFLKDEREGLLEGLADIRNVEMVEINVEPSLRYVASRLSRDGSWEGDGFPVKRGSTLRLDDRTALVWVHGATEGVDGRRTYYQGKSRIPAPLVVIRHHGSSPLSVVASEILGLSKMDWNTFDLYTKMPATVQSSNQIARIGTLLERFGPASYDYRLFI